MAVKFDQQKVKQQLFHISITLTTILVCLVYIQNQEDWSKIGKFSDYILFFLFIGEIFKIYLTKYFSLMDKDSLTQQKFKHNKKITTTSSIKDISIGFIVQLITTIFYGFICIILGAPVLQNYEETLVLSTILTILTISPIVMLFGVSGTLLICFCEKMDFLTKSEEVALNLHKYHMTGAIFGGWAASLVAPLDWDRDWQIYPIPNIIGALLGCGLLNMYVCTKVLFTTAKAFLKKRS